MASETRRAQAPGGADDRDGLAGIVVSDARYEGAPQAEPRIAAFIWGGKVRPTPTLPFGRWKGAA